MKNSPVGEPADHWMLDSKVTYLNHGAFGACPRVVLEAQSEWRARLEREPVRFFLRELEQHLDEVRSVVGALVNAEPADIVFVANATAGVNTVLASQRFDPGDEVLVTNHGYNACLNAAEYWTARAGAIARRATVPFPIERPAQVVEAVLAAVTSRTRLAVLDHTTSPTGLILTRRDRASSVRPLVISHGANATRTDRSRYFLEFDWQGTSDVTALLSVPAALRFLESLFEGGMEGLRMRNRSLALAARQVLCTELGTPPPCPDEMIGSLAAVFFPDVTPQMPTANELWDRLEQVHAIQVPIVPWPERASGFVRIAAQAYNKLPQYEKLAGALSSELGLREA